jgi:F420-non-reducing hydrogenase iron-sulfur subunit
MCTGRIDPAFILRAFSNGVDGVFIGGCWLGECHYVTEGNYDAVSMMLLTRKLLEHIGISPERLRLEWVSAAQGNRFAEVVTDFTNELKELGPLGTSEGIEENRMKLKLEAAKSIVPYLKLVERESLRVRFKTREEYEEFFNSDRVNKIFKESVVEKLAMQEILLLLREKPFSIDEFSDVLGLSRAEISRYLNTSARNRLTRFDEKQKRFALV